MSYKVFIVSDPTPWIYQFIQTAKVMVDKCGGSSVEFIINNMLSGMGKPDHLVLAACEEGTPETLVGWLMATYIYDTKSPWVEVWALWAKPGTGLVMRELASDILINWARAMGAKRIVAVLTRNPRVFLKMFHEALDFKQVGIVIEKEL